MVRFYANQLIELMELYEKGFTDKEIAERIKSSYGTVSAYRVKLGLKPNKLGSLFSDQQFMELYEQGFTDKEMAVFMCVSKGKLSYRREKLGLKANEPPDLVSDEVFMEIYEQGLSDHEIVDKLKMSLGYVKKKRAKLGLTVAGNRYFTDEEFMALHEQGLSDREIAENLKIFQTTVKRHKAKLGLTTNWMRARDIKLRLPKRYSLTPRELIKLVALYEEGVRNPEIAHELKVPISLVSDSRVLLGLHANAKLRLIVNRDIMRRLHSIASDRLMSERNTYRVSLLSERAPVRVRNT